MDSTDLIKILNSVDANHFKKMNGKVWVFINDKNYKLKRYVIKNIFPSQKMFFADSINSNLKSSIINLNTDKLLEVSHPKEVIKQGLSPDKKGNSTQPSPTRT